ncbi:MAG: hypothetical protein AABW92_00055 [Nanoarchaeota archaeon]
MNKKGVIWEDLSDLMLGGSLIILAVVTFIIFTSLHDITLQKRIENKADVLNNDDVFVSMLNTELENTTLTDIIISAHISQKPEELEEKLGGFLANIYQDDVCWVLYIEDEKFIDKNKCNEEKGLLDSTVQLPLPDKTLISVRLNIKGYAE